MENRLSKAGYGLHPRLKSSVWWALLLIGLTSCLSVLEDRSYFENTAVKLFPDTIYYSVLKVFPEGYGFSIYKRRKLWIYQPVIPTVSGMRPFPTESSAEMAARLLTDRLRHQQFRFLLLANEIDSILQVDASGKWVTGKIIPGVAMHGLKPGNGDTIPGQTEICVLHELAGPPVKARWKTLGSVPFGPRGAMVGFSIGRYVYMGGGEIKDQPTRDFWRYDPVTDAWTCMADLPGIIRTHATGFSIENRGYFGLGTKVAAGKDRFLRDFYAYDPESNSWHRRADFLGEARLDATSFSTGGKGYIGLGYAESYRDDFFAYDPAANRWDRIPDFPGGVISGAAGVSSGNSGFVICGDRPPGNQKFLYEYLPHQKRWTQRKDLPGPPRYFSSAFTVDSRFFISGAGGMEGGENRLRDVYLYDQESGEWTSIPDYPVSKAGTTGATGGTVNGVIYAGTGYDGFYQKDWNAFEYYFQVRTDTGIYDEGGCYSLGYSGNWEMYEECRPDNCFAGAAIKTTENLGEFCYSSLVEPQPRTVQVKYQDRMISCAVFPRNFSLSVEKKPNEPLGIRLFYTRKEICDLLGSLKGNNSLSDALKQLAILQCTNPNPDTDLQNNGKNPADIKVIQPAWYQYGYEGSIWVAEFNVATLHSEFYLALLYR